jgi:ferredoxin like protein
VVDDQLDLRLATLVFRADPEPHIVVQTDLCLDCAERPCLFACPARLFVWEGGQMVFTCEGCLECGSCRVVCHREAVSWRYPRGGFGVRYRWG